MTKKMFITNLVKINIPRFSSITQLEQDPTRHFRYLIVFILDEILHSYLNRLIFGCLSFTGGLITSSSTADSEAPASRRTFVTSVASNLAAMCRGVRP